MNTNTIANKLVQMVENTMQQIKDNEFPLFKPSYFNDEMVENIMGKANNLIETLSNIKDTVSLAANKIVNGTICVVRFDKAFGEKLFYTVKDGELKVKVTYKDENTNETRITNVSIPSHITKDDIQVITNSKLKTALFVLKDEGEKTKANKKKPKTATKKTKTIQRDSKGRFVRV